MFACRAIVLAILSFAACATPDASPKGVIEPTDLRCEGRVDPIDVEERAPHLSWIDVSIERAQRQSAYHVLVASDPEKLAPGEADLWDSGRVDSSRSIHVAYAGKPLASNARAFWTVRVWDGGGGASEWAKPAQWTCALVEPGAWRAQWITSTSMAEDSNPLRAAQWLWTPNADGSDFAHTPVGASCTFARTIAGEKPVASVRVIAAGDNDLVVGIGDQRFARHRSWQTATTCESTGPFASGPLRVTCEVTNGGNAPNPAGFIAAIEVRFADGTRQTYLSDAGWLAGDRGCIALGAYGMEPWGRVTIGTGPLPIFRKAFELDKPVRRALVHASLLGHGELWLNGAKVGAEFLDPPWTQYEKSVTYVTHDVTPLLKRGRNSLGVLLGKGFYRTTGDRRRHGIDRDPPLCLALQCDVEYEDGTRETIVTDTSWKWIDGPLTHDCILAGSDWDARKLPRTWSEPAFDDARWSRSVTTSGPGGKLVARLAPPLATFDEFQPRSIEEPEPGVYVYDFAQNCAALPKLAVEGRAGATLRLTYAEQRHGQTDRRNNGHGRVDQSGIGSPAYWQYTLDGSGVEQWMPPTTYAGFQYLELEGAVPAGRPNPNGLPVVKSLASVHVRAACEPIGTFACSKPLFNDVDRMIEWAVKSNLSHVLTDCPHREKLGWLEVAYLMFPSIASRWDVSSFARKICRDMRDSQGENGEIWTVAPDYPRFSGGYRFTPEWGAAAVLVPWLAYRWYGDERVLDENFEMMKRFVDYLESTSKEHIAAPGLGDWYDYGHDKGLGPSQFTPTELTATATFALCARAVSDAAGVLGREREQREYRELNGAIQAAFRKRFHRGEHGFENFGSCQTAHAMALYASCVEPDESAYVLEDILDDLEKRGHQQTSGDVGHVYLLRALADRGRSSAIFQFLDRDVLGSYGYLVKGGWTSLPEAWNADPNSSMNHCMLGHAQEWFDGSLAGLQLAHDAVAFERFVIKPTPVGDVKAASATHRSPYGDIACSWKLERGRFVLEARIPVNTSADIGLPTSRGPEITESGRPAAEARGVTLLRCKSGLAVYRVESGHYRFESIP